MKTEKWNVQLRQKKTRGLVSNREFSSEERAVKYAEEFWNTPQPNKDLTYLTLIYSVYESTVIKKWEDNEDFDIHQ